MKLYQIVLLLIYPLGLACGQALFKLASANMMQAGRPSFLLLQRFLLCCPHSLWGSHYSMGLAFERRPFKSSLPLYCIVFHIHANIRNSRV